MNHIPNRPDAENMAQMMATAPEMLAELKKIQEKLIDWASWAERGKCDEQDLLHMAECFRRLAASSWSLVRKAEGKQ